MSLSGEAGKSAPQRYKRRFHPDAVHSWEGGSAARPWSPSGSGPGEAGVPLRGASGETGAPVSQAKAKGLS